MSTPKKQKSPSFGCRQPLDRRLRSAMIQWLEFKLTHLEAALIKLKRANREVRLAYLENNIVYYKHAVACTKWLIAQMKSKKTLEGVNMEDIDNEPQVDAVAGV